MSIGDAIGGVVGAGASVAGGLLSSSANKKMQRRQQAWEREVFQNQMQWRVADAKAAGLHPLAALGMQPASPGGSFPIPDTVGPSLAEAGQHLGTAIARQTSTEEKVRNELSNKLLEAQIGETDARRMAINSQTMRDMMAGQAGGAGLGGVSEMGQAPNPPGMIQANPVQEDSAKIGVPGSVAGTHPAQQKHMLGSGPFALPFWGPATKGESLEEVLSEVNPLTMWGYINQNVKRYGWKWLEDFVKLRYFGQLPTGKHPDPGGSYVPPRRDFWDYRPRGVLKDWKEYDKLHRKYKKERR